MEGWTVDEEESCTDQGLHGRVHILHDIGISDDMDSFSTISSFVWCCTRSISSGLETIQTQEFIEISTCCQKVGPRGTCACGEKGV
jgi:hypothetical protein